VETVLHVEAVLHAVLHAVSVRRVIESGRLEQRNAVTVRTLCNTFLVKHVGNGVTRKT